MWVRRNQLQFHSAWGCNTLVQWNTGKRFASLAQHEMMAEDWLPPFLCDEPGICWGWGGVAPQRVDAESRKREDTPVLVLPSICPVAVPVPHFGDLTGPFAMLEQGESKALTKAVVQLGVVCFLVFFVSTFVLGTHVCNMCVTLVWPLKATWVFQEQIFPASCPSLHSCCLHFETLNALCRSTVFIPKWI